MSENKRRLSNNKGFLGQLAEEEDDDDDNNIKHGMNSGGRGGISNRRSLGGRRRSSFGSHSSKSPGSSVEQSRIAEMYRNVIKMSSENVRLLLDISNRIDLHVFNIVLRN